MNDTADNIIEKVQQYERMQVRLMNYAKVSVMIIVSFVTGMLTNSCREANIKLNQPVVSGASTTWIVGNPVSGLIQTNGQPTIALMEHTEFGLRSDGVVVWKAK